MVPRYAMRKRAKNMSPEELLAKVTRGDVPVAVFTKLPDNELMTTRINSELFQEAMRKPKKVKLFGIYDKNCQIEWLKEDMIHAGLAGNQS